MTIAKHANPWQTTGSNVVYDNPWIRVREDAVIRPDGKPGIYGVVELKNRAIGVLPIDDEGRVHLVGQFRYTLNKYSWEVPEGGCPAHEDLLDAAKRELLEETGLQAGKWTSLGMAHLSNCITDEESYFYLATELTQGQADPEGCEVLERRCLPFDEVLDMVRAGEITDAVTVMAVLRYEAFVRR